MPPKKDAMEIITSRSLTRDKRPICIPDGTRKDVRVRVGDENKRIILTCPDVQVAVDYSRNPFKSSKDSGYVTLTLQKDDLRAVKYIDTAVTKIVQVEPRLRTLDQIRMTPRTWAAIFRGSATGDQLKLTVARNMVGFFDRHGKPIAETEESSPWNALTTGVRVAVTIEPAFLWVFNRRAGITWTLCQVRFLADKIDMSRVTDGGEWTMQPDSD